MAINVLVLLTNHLTGLCTGSASAYLRSILASRCSLNPRFALWWSRRAPLRDSAAEVEGFNDDLIARSVALT